MSTSSSSPVSTQTCTMPGPNGPSRSTVCGTTCSPAASDIRNVATSRPARVPSGKSHSGRSPRTGLYTHCSSIPSTATVPNRVAFEASTSRPVISSRPCRRTAGTAGSRGSTCGGSVPDRGPLVVPVEPDAHVALGVERLGAQRARRPTGGDHALGAAGELAGLHRGEEHAQGVRALLGVVQHDRLVDLLLAHREEFDHDGARVGVPAQAHGADPELLLERHGQRVEVAARRLLGGVPAEPAGDLPQEGGHALGQHRDLLLLQQHADRAGLLDRLQVEGAVAGLAYGPGDEALGLAEDVDDARHDLIEGRPLGRGWHIRWAWIYVFPPTTASEDGSELAFSSSPSCSASPSFFSGGGIRLATS